ncbi:hypothetical protein QZH41_006188 [Actinostola sp. cb2023]|nr:hypothetical protein QZH41_006188 [Actinostola sp. cb2023]
MFIYNKPLGRNHRMSYIHKPRVQPLEHRTPFQLLSIHAEAHPNKEAFVFRDTTKNRIPITFQEFQSKSESLAAGLLQIGLSRGDRVLLMVPSRPEFLFLYMALNRIGAIAIIDEEDSHPTIKSIKNLACVISKTDYKLPLQWSSGEICTRAAWVAFHNPDMLITSKQPVKPREQRSTWHHLSDGGCFDAQGRLKLLGRIDNMIKCATESVQPLLVEEVLYQHPDVEKVCVVGVPDQRLYQKICACIVMKAHKQGNQAVFDQWSDENFDEMSLGLKLKPHYYLFFDGFPLTRTGKLSRRLTKDLAIKTLGLI